MSTTTRPWWAPADGIALPTFAEMRNDPTLRYNPNHDEHGKFAAGGGATATKTAPYSVNGITPKIVDLDNAEQEWGGYQESVEARFAADEMLGSYSDYGYELARPEVATAITEGTKVGDPPWVQEGAQAAYDRAYTLLDAVHNAEPTTIPLYRGVTDDSQMGAGLDRLATGDQFDISLASFSGDRTIAEGYAPPEGGYMFALAPGAQALALPYTETETQVHGEWQQVPGDAVTSGRFEVTGRSGSTINIKQVGTFAPPGRSITVHNYRRPPFWRAFDPPKNRPQAKRFNPNHDEHGKFASGGGASSDGALVKYMTPEQAAEAVQTGEVPFAPHGVMGPGVYLTSTEGGAGWPQVIKDRSPGTDVQPVAVPMTTSAQIMNLENIPADQLSTWGLSRSDYGNGTFVEHAATMQEHVKAAGFDGAEVGAGTGYHQIVVFDPSLVTVAGKRSARFNPYHDEGGKFTSGGGSTATAEYKNVGGWADSRYPESERFAPGRAGVAFRIVPADELAAIHSSGEIVPTFGGMGHQAPGVYVTTDTNQLQEYGSPTDTVLALHIDPADGVYPGGVPGTYRLDGPLPASRIVDTYSGALRFNPFHGFHGWFASGESAKAAAALPGAVHDAADRWQGDKSDVASVRDAANALITGEKPPHAIWYHHAETDARALIQGVQDGEPSTQMLYRGMGVPNPDYQVGQTVNFALGSFTEDKDFAHMATSELWNDQWGATPVMYQLEPGAKTLDFKSVGVEHDEEHLTGGAFQVTHVEPYEGAVNAHGEHPMGVAVTLRQTDVVHVAA